MQLCNMKVQRIQRYHGIFARKYKTLENVNIPGPDAVVLYCYQESYR